MKAVRIIFLVYFVLAVAVAAKSPSLKDLMNLKYPRTLEVHPRGDWFLYEMILPDFQQSRWQRQIWIQKIGAEQPIRLTQENFRDYSARFSPDGQWITFLSSREYLNASGKKVSGKTQVWAISLRGGDPQVWTDLPTGVEDYRWSPDGRFLVLLATEEKPAAIKRREKERERLKFDATVKDSVVEKLVFWKFDLQSKQTHKIVVADAGVEEFRLSPDGHWIVYQTNYTGKYDDEQKYDLWVVEIARGRKIQITDFPGPEIHPRFSPDGRYIAYVKQTTPDIEFAETDLAVLAFDTAAATPDTVNLTDHFNRSVEDYQWVANRRLVARVAVGLETHLYEIDRRKKKSPRRIDPLEGNVGTFHYLPGKKQFIYLWEDATHLPEIALLQKGKQRLLTRFSRQIADWSVGTQRKIQWKSSGDQVIEGIVFLPENFRPGKKYPLILTLHGGPYGRFRNVFRQYYFPQMYTADGYIVLAPNPRGSSGYDDAFGKAIWYKVGGHMGGVDYQDVMAGVDYLIEKGWVDEQRMGVTGGSYGGYLTNWVISQTNRFSAAVSMFGIFSLFTDWSNSWQPSWEKMYFGIYYWEQPINPEHPYVKYSPAFHVTNIRTPVLILHGDRDRYTNLANSQEMYQALHTLGREVKFVIYPREGHGIGREPNHRLDVYRRAKAWFDAHLKQ